MSPTTRRGSTGLMRGSPRSQLRHMIQDPQRIVVDTLGDGGRGAHDHEVCSLSSSIRSATDATTCDGT
jgi:hypothetical protein